MPNLALWVFLGTIVVRGFLSADSGARPYFDWLGLAALSWWALDELIRGVNPWRRVLGLGGAALAAANLVSLLH